MHARDSFQSSVSESEKSAMLSSPSFLSLALEDFSPFSCSVVSEVLRP